MLLQVRRVSTVILHTEMRLENAIENRKGNSNAGSGLGSKRSSAANSMGNLGAQETENVSKQQSNDTQGAATHSRLGSKKSC